MYLVFISYQVVFIYTKLQWPRRLGSKILLTSRCFDNPSTTNMDTKNLPSVGFLSFDTLSTLIMLD